MLHGSKESKNLASESARLTDFQGPSERQAAPSNPSEITPLLLRSILIRIVVLPLSFTAMVAVLFLIFTVSLLKSSERLDRTDQVITQSHRVQTLLLDMETGIRGFLITGHTEYLQPYTAAVAALDSSLEELTRLVKERPTQSRRIRDLRGLISRWKRHAEEMVASEQAGIELPKRDHLYNTGRMVMEELRVILNACINDEQALRDRDSHLARSIATAELTGTGVVAVCLGLVLLSITRRKLGSVSACYEAALRTVQERSEALRRSEARFQAFMEFTPAATFVKDEAGRYIYGNKAWATLFAKPIEELLGQNDVELRNEVIARDFEASDAIVRAKNTPIKIAATTRDGEGRVRHWMTLKYPLDDGSGQGLIGGISIDVTELHQVGQDLRASEERYQLAMRGSSAGLWDWQRRHEGLYLSSRFKELLGYEDHEIENSLEAISRLTHPEDRNRMLSGFEQHLKSQLPFDLEYRLRTKSGEYRWFHARGEAIRDASGRAVRSSGSITDITARKLAEAENLALNAVLEQRVRRLASLRKVDSAITGGQNLQTILELALDQVKAELQIDACDILLLETRSLTLVNSAHWGFRTEAMKNAAVTISHDDDAQALLKLRSLSIPDVTQTDETLLRAADFAFEGFVGYHAVPLVSKGELKGILEVFHRSAPEIDQEWIDFLELIASQITIVLENVNLYEGLRRANTELILAYDATIEGWSHALDLRDKETEGHCRRVTEMTVRLARAMGIGADELTQIRRGALLHDIGKMGIPDRILLKPGPLDEAEWRIMKQHPDYAREIISRIDFLRPALDIPYCHHEKWDGSGYPRGLVGEEIPLAARIFTVADIWDALSNDRPYRKAWPQGRVMDHIASLAGNALDPAVVKVFLRLHATGAENGLDISANDYLRTFPFQNAKGEPGDSSPEADGLSDSRPAWTADPLADPSEAAPIATALNTPLPSVELTVLIASPQPSTANSLRAILEAMGHEVLVAPDGLKAWETIQADRVHALVVDLALPEVDGLELCRRIRDDANLSTTYFILICDREDQRLHQLSVDVDDFLTKPVDPRELISRIARARRIFSAEERLVKRTAQARRMYFELRDQNERLTELVATDPLTGLSNRRHLLEFLENQTALAKRLEQPFSLAILDVDHFKEFNDVHGHRAGDDVLCRIADVLRNNVRACDLVARYGGEEFVVVMPMTPVEGSRDVAERLRAAIAECDWTLRPITSSFGVATMKSATLEISALVDAADQALYRSKQGGRNRVTHSSELDPAGDSVSLLSI